MTELRKELKKFQLSQNERPFVVSPDLAQLFVTLGERGGSAIILAMIIQRIAHMGTKTKSLSLEKQEYFDLFPFVDQRFLRKCIYILRKYGIWKNDKYRPHTGMVGYRNIRISWPAIARLARRVQKQKQENEIKEMCQRMNKEVSKCNKLESQL